MRVPAQAGPDPVELRRVDARQLDEADVDTRVAMAQLGAQGLEKALERVLGAAVARLQRDAAARQRRADLDDRPLVAREEAPQRDARSVNRAQVRDLGD